MNKSIWTGFGFFTGVSYPFKAIDILRKNRRLWKYLIIPLLINIIVGIGTYILLLRPSLNWFDTFTTSLLVNVDRYLNSLPQWLSFLVYIVGFLTTITKFILLILIFIIVGFVITQFGSILGSPWYGKLSEKIEVFRTEKLKIIELNIAHDLSRAVLFEFKKLGLIVMISFPLFFTNLLPAFGHIVSFIGSLTLTVTIVCLDFFDSVLERRRLKFRQKLQFVLRGFPSTFGFGLVCLALTSIPLLNLISIPICVCAGTLFVCDLYSA